MNKFIDRNTQYQNRKNLTIKNIEYDSNGEISKLLVDLERSEGVVYQSGTKLNARNLNSIIQSMIDTAVSNALTNLMSYEIKPHIDYTYESRNLTVFPGGLSAAYNVFTIPINESITVEIKNDYADLFEVTYTTTSSGINVQVHALANQSDSGSSEYEFKVILISSQTGKVVHKVFCTVIYEVPSVTPND